MSRLDLDIDLGRAASSGRRVKEVVWSVEGEICEADIQLMATTERGIAAPKVQRITDRHHSLARLIAAGVPIGEAAMLTRYTNSRASILMDSPAFQELVSLYRKEVDFQFSSMLEHMHHLGMDAIVELQERLEDNPEDFTIKDLLAITNDMGDRTGAPRMKETKTEVTVNLGDKLEMARRRARAAVEAQIEDAEIIEDSE